MKLAPTPEASRYCLQWACSVMVFLSSCGFGLASAPSKASAAKAIDEPVRDFLAKHCQACHSGEKPKGKFALRELSADFADKAGQTRSRAVLEQLQVGAMPPKPKPRPPEKELQSFTNWIGTNLLRANARQRAAEGRAVFRRLNRVEYENTVRDLLGTQVELQDLLPADNSAGGFDNVGEALHVSPFLVEKYLEAADTALSRAITNGPQPRLVKQHTSLRLTKSDERIFLRKGETVVCFSSYYAAAAFWLPAPGKYRFRISALGYQSSGKPVSFRVQTQWPGKRGKAEKHLIGFFDAPADKPTVVEFIDYLQVNGGVEVLPYGLPSDAVHKAGAAGYEGPGLAVHWLEVEGPLHDTWPPASHRRIFGDLPQAKVPRPGNNNHLEVVSKDPDADARRILRNFARRTFRRPVREEDIELYAALVKAKLAEKYSFEQAVRVALTAVMVSPDFLFLREQPGKLDDFALASRLSYFLWSTMPDDELLALADQKKLGQPDRLRQQVERMLKDTEGGGIHGEFPGAMVEPARNRFHQPQPSPLPGVRRDAAPSMVREPELFFNELLTHNLRLANFVASDFSMLNGRLAKHYGIPGVEGWQFRKVPLPKDSHRGGVLTMASVLKVTANGTNTSPVLRGAWVLDRILGTPPPRPPADVPPSSRTFAAPPPSANNWPSIGKSPRAQPAMPGSIRRDSPWRALMSLAVGGKIIGPPAKAPP